MWKEIVDLVFRFSVLNFKLVIFDRQYGNDSPRRYIHVMR